MEEKQKPKKSLATLIVLVLLTFNNSGCIFWMFGPQGDYIYRDRTKTFYISITSEPSDANIHIYDKIVGKTPAKRIPVKVNYGIAKSQMLYVGTPWAIVNKSIQHPEVAIEKEGYKTKLLDLQFCKEGSSRLILEPKYHIELEKEEKNSQK